MSQVVLITGCSTGIGRDLAQRLTQAGYTVVATARHLESLTDLEAALKLPLDVTHPDSINGAVAATLQQFGRIDVLVNNAGYAVFGAVEEISEKQAEGLFDVNVFGVMRMIRAVAPHLRRQKSGRIINISSIAGKLATPTNGAYSATKFALEALTDALRIELAPFGVQVVLVEPGSINTHFHATAETGAQSIIGNPASPYQPLYHRVDEVFASMRQGEAGPEVVSRVIQEAIEAPHPKARYLAGVPVVVKLVMALGDGVWDMVMRQRFKVGVNPHAN